MIVARTRQALLSLKCNVVVFGAHRVVDRVRSGDDLLVLVITRAWKVFLLLLEDLVHVDLLHLLS